MLLQGRGTKKTCKCPVAGCTAIWTSESGSFDEEFQRKIDRIQRLQSSNPKQTILEELDEDDDDADYTQIN